MQPCKTYAGQVEHLTYKTIRYPGHLNHMKFLFNDLHLKNKEILEKLFDKEVPRTTDVIIFYVKVIGEKDGVLKKNLFKKIYGDQNLVQFKELQLPGYVAA